MLHSLAAVGLALALPGCDEDLGLAEHHEPRLLSDGAFVGAVDGSDMKIGVALEGDKIRLYTCAGPSQLESSRWFKGTVSDEQFELESGAWTIVGAVTGGRLEGALLTPEGDALPWSADPAAPGTYTGLYAAPTGSCNSGVVIRQDEPGGPFEAQGTWCDGQGNFAQIIVLAPLAPSPRGVAVQVARGRDRLYGAGQTFYVSPAAP